MINLLSCRYWETLLEIMWPRFEYLLQMNIQSIRDCDPQRLGQIDVRPHYVSTRQTLLKSCLLIELKQPNCNCAENVTTVAARKVIKPDVIWDNYKTFVFCYFQITRRYAEYSAAIVGISQSYPSDIVNRLFSQLQSEVENFILRMAAEFPQRKEQLVFLINNYDMMLGVLMVSVTFTIL